MEELINKTKNNDKSDTSIDSIILPSATNALMGLMPKVPCEDVRQMLCSIAALSCTITHKEERHSTCSRGDSVMHRYNFCLFDYARCTPGMQVTYTIRHTTQHSL